MGISAKELRIGNLVSRLDLGDHSLRVESVLELRKDKVLTTGPISVICLYSEIKPIPLTEEWLLKFGFEKRDVEFPSYTKKGIQINYLDGKWVEYVRRIEVKTVHQLQNLFYCLCGIDLELNK